MHKRKEKKRDYWRNGGVRKVKNEEVKNLVGGIYRKVGGEVYSKCGLVILVDNVIIIFIIKGVCFFRIEMKND